MITKFHGAAASLARTLAPALAAISIAGCALAPGIHMSDAEVTERAHEQQGNDSFQITQVSPYIIARLAKEQAAAMAARQPDPNVKDFATYQYKIAPLDVLSVVVWDHPELTSPTGQFRGPEDNGLSVYADGTMFYPFVGYFNVAGKTVIEVQQELTRRLRYAIKEPQVSVRVASFRGKRIEVTGEVKAPQTVNISDIPLRVSDAVVKAGGFVPESNPASVTLQRGGKVVPLDLMSFYEDGDVKQNWLLLDGDVVHVGHVSRSQVYVFGEVKKAGTKPMYRGRLNLAQALGDSEGFDYATMKPAVYVFREIAPGRPEIFRLDVSTADSLILAAQFALKPRDVVFIASNDLARFNRVVGQIAPAVNLIWQTWNMITTTKVLLGL
jgi:polysaccharide export outer membrane protein